MIRNSLFGIGLIITLIIISVSLTGCGSDDDDGTAADNGGGGKASGGGGGTTPSGNNTFTGILLDSLDETPIPNATVKALDNLTLEELSSETSSGIDGKFTLEKLPDGEICVFTVGNMNGAYPIFDSRTYNVKTNEQDLEIHAMRVLPDIIATAPCGPNDPTVGNVSGAVYYYNEAGEEFMVGCATVEVEPMGPDTVVYYFQGGIASVGDQAEPCDRPNIGEGRLLETSTDGHFYASKVPEGIVTLTAKVNGQPIGKSEMKIIKPENSTGGMYNLNITRIYADKTGNPTPECVSE